MIQLHIHRMESFSFSSLSVGGTVLRSLQDISSPTRNEAKSVQAVSPNHWTNREVPLVLLLLNFQEFFVYFG